jgi:hypothetical protein
MNTVYICYLKKEHFSHVVSDVEYLGQTTLVDITSKSEAKENDIVIFIGTDYRWYEETRFIATIVKDVYWDDSPAVVYILNSLYDLSYINEDFKCFIETMEYEKEPNTLIPFSSDGKLVKILLPQFYRYLNPEP